MTTSKRKLSKTVLLPLGRAFGAAMKISYDLLLTLALRGHRPPEERRAGGQRGSAGLDRSR